MGPYAGTLGPSYIQFCTRTLREIFVSKVRGSGFAVWMLASQFERFRIQGLGFIGVRLSQL